MDSKLLGGIEAGGTKFICAVASQPNTPIAQIEIPTTSPEETLGRVIDFFKSQPAIQAIGIACFGPLDLDPASPKYGYIVDTPKYAWNDVDIVGQIQQALNVPVAIDSDVNTAALGESTYGAGKDLDSLTYITVGTGIGIGQADGKSHTRHAEGGHMLVPRLPGDALTSTCPYHGDCLEGLASGFALQQRLGKPAQEAAAGDPIWELAAEYIAYGVTNVIFLTMPERIVIGGGVMQHEGLLASIQQKVVNNLHGYSVGAQLATTIDTYLVSPELQNLSGVTGALEMAAQLSA